MIRAFTRWTWLLSLLLSLGFHNSYAQEETDEASSEKVKVKVTGVVKGEQGEGYPDAPLFGADVVVQGKSSGTTTDRDGKFTIEVKAKLPIKIAITALGYKATVLSVNREEYDFGEIVLEAGPVLGQNLVSGPARKNETEMQSAVSLEVINSESIKEMGGHDYFDAMSDFVGIESVTTSLGFEVYNTRGFNNTFNTRFMQIVDGVDNAMPSFNLSVSNLMGPSELDIHQIELLPGTGSPIYGSGALNGAMLTTTKDPFKYQGLSAMAKTGVNHINPGGGRNHYGDGDVTGIDSDDGVSPEASAYFQAGLRYAKTFMDDRLAIKLDGSLTRGNDWWATDFTNLNSVGGSRWDDAAFNGLNVYGDEDVRPINNILEERTELVTRTGYDEKYLTNYDVINYRGNAGIYFKPTKKITVGYEFGMGYGDNMMTSFNRIRFKNASQWRHKAEVKGKNFFVRGTMTSESTGDTYDLGLTAINMNRAWKSDDLWYSDYEEEFNRIFNGTNKITAHRTARLAADRGRLNPGTAEFERELQKTRGINDYGRGGNMLLESVVYNGEGMFDLSPYTSKIVDVVVGGNYKFYEVQSFNNIMIDNDANELTNFERGGYLQLSRKLLKNENIKITVSARYDQSEQVEDDFISPRASIVYTGRKGDTQHNLRVAYQQGFRMPSIMEQFMNVDMGNATILGGLPGVYDAFDINDNPNVYTLASANQFLDLYEDEISNGISPTRVLTDSSNIDILESYNFSTLSPESVTTYEAGYKALFAGRFMVDLTGYYSEYQNFIGLRYVVRPAIDGTVDVGGNLRNIRDRDFATYGIYDNSASTVNSYGGVANFVYRSVKGYRVSASYALNMMDLGEDADDLVAAFNAPEHRASLSFGQKELSNNKNLGFNITWNWQDSYEWRSVYSEGLVKSFNTFDAQVSYKLESIKSIVKLGGSNLLNTRYSNYYGGPNVGALYYVSVTFDPSSF